MNLIDPQIAILLTFYTIFLVFAFFSVLHIRKYMRAVIAMMRNNREFKKQEKKHQEMLENGGFHNWQDYDYFGDGKTILKVCSKTGWCPSLKGYLPVKVLQAYDKLKEQQAEEKVFRDKYMQSLSKKHELPLPKMEEISKDIFQIKKDWHLLLMAKKMKEKSNDVQQK